MSDNHTITVQEAAEALALLPCGSSVADGRPVSGVVVSDLLSYVMAEGKPGNIWLTIQTHSNIIAVAALAGISAVVISAGFTPEEETVTRAEDEGIALFTSPATSYELAGKLYLAGAR